MVDAYTSNGASGHTVKGDTHLVERCDGCGAVFTDVVRTEGVSYDEPHTLSLIHILAELRGEDPETLAEQLWENTAKANS